MAADRLTLQQVAEYLRVEPIQVSRLVRQGDIPFSGPAAKPLFDREEIDAWASRRILGMNDKRLANYHTESEKPVKGDDGSFSVCDMISAERIVLDLPSKTKASVLADVTKIADEAGLLYDPHDLLESLRAREELCSTGLGNGVAIIHPRHHDPYLATESYFFWPAPRTPSTLARRTASRRTSSSSSYARTTAAICGRSRISASCLQRRPCWASFARPQPPRRCWPRSAQPRRQSTGDDRDDASTVA